MLAVKTMTETVDLPEASEPERDLAQAAVKLAEKLLVDAKTRQTSAEKAQAAKLSGMMTDPNGKTLTMLLPDLAFRSQTPARIADQINYLLDQYGVPSYLPLWERLGLKLGSQLAQYLPQLVIPFITAKLRQETQTVILPGEEQALQQYLQKRRQGNIRLNLNHLGEAVLGEGEAGRRFESYLKLLARDDVEYISVKISSIFSQINLVAFDQTVEEIKARLRQLYRAAMTHHYKSPDGRSIPKFVNLDMEEYRDLHLTVDAFCQVLDESEFHSHKAGLVLQAYLPDSAQVQRALTEWAIKRVERGGAPIKIRIVKGANLAMEQVEASLHGWEQAPYPTKVQVDANYKRMLHYGCRPERAQAVNLGVASHNLFDIAYGLLLREQHGVEAFVDFEMLEGMANHQARAVQDAADGLLLYAPIVKRNDFHSAIAYLVRRLDENTAKENFLHDLFDLEVGSSSWNKQRDAFLNAVDQQHSISDQPRRRQNRLYDHYTMDPDTPFQNEPDTDWSLPANQAWIKEIVTRWSQHQPEPVPLQIGGQFIDDDFSGEGHDPSRPGKVAYRYALASPEQIDRALDGAVQAQTRWAAKSISERKRLLVKCAEALANQRGELIGSMILDGGKLVTEADGEVSEAIDFANYYARSFDPLEVELAAHDFTPLGVVLVTPPWNFPLAIPCGGVLAALMAGNAVILKPAPEAVLVAWQLVNVLWQAGIPKEVLQFVPTTDDEVGRGLVTDDRVNGVILTGAYETGQLFQSWKPDIRLFAETSGKNSLIITAMADHDQAVKDLVKSAFGHAGQKCSAASLAILEAEVYDNPGFRRQLRDAAASLKVGSAWDLSSIITPTIRQPGEVLCRALETLEPGESWLLEPKIIDNNPNLWTPGIKLGVKPGTFFHKTECFGPVLGLIRVDSLEQAIAIANDSEFGLTGGLHSLDKREITLWRENIEVGNAYVNRSTTGAIVQRQPFGGWKKSVFGYAKAGGPNYVLSLGTWRSKQRGIEEDILSKAEASYQQAWQNHFSQAHDPSQILGESNIFRYRPIERLILRVEDQTQLTQAKMVTTAAQICGVRVTISVADGVNLGDIQNNASAFVEDDAGLINRLQNEEMSRLRVLQPISTAVRQAANAQHIAVVDDPVVANGRLELRHYLREQAVSETTHRYGNVVVQTHS